MSEFPCMDKARNDFAEIVAASRLCFDKQLVLRTLTLLYVGIDAAGWLAAENPDPGRVRGNFTSWVDRYLLSHKQLKATGSNYP
jgi:hypothetical protein